jgi:phenylacetate-CoA ligase
MVHAMPLSGPDVLGPAARDPGQPFWDPEMQTMDRERLRSLQDERVRDMVRRIFETPVPFFRRKLESAGIGGPGDVKGVDDLAAIPFTVKQELRDAEEAVPPYGDYRFTDRHQCIRLGLSTGTTGTPTVRLWTRHDLWVEYESGSRTWWRTGWRPGMSVTHAHPSFLYGGGALLSGLYEYFGMLNIWVPPPETDELAEVGIRAWMRFRPDIPFAGYSLGRYFEVCHKLGLDPYQDVGLRTPVMEGPSEDKPLQSGGSDCYAFLGGSCGQSRGAHLHEDWAVVQAIDPETGLEVPDGEWGALCITTLDRDNGLLRYNMEEAAAIIREPCSCGETTVRGVWAGRFSHLLTSQGRRFQAVEVERTLRADVPDVAEPSLEYEVVRPAHEDAPLVVRLEEGGAGGDHADLVERCTKAIQARLGIQATVEVLPRQALPRYGYKATRVVDA